MPMDFTKVKMLLIAVFLCLNVFLFIQWRVLEANVSVYAEPLSDQFANAQSALANSNVRVQAVLPTNIIPLSLVSVRADAIPVSTVASSVFSLKPSQVIPWIVSRNVIDGPFGTIQAVHPGRFFVQYHIPALPELADKHGQTSGIRSWVAKHVYNGNAYSFLGWTATKGDRTAVFNQEVSGYPVFSAPLNVHLNGRFPVGYDQTLLTVVTVKPPKPVISPVSALLSLAQYLQKTKINTPNEISDVRLGYYSAIVTSVGWYLSPVWRVSTIRGVFFVNAFTGEVEVAPA